MLQRLPVGLIKPVPFYPGSRSELERLVKHMQQTYSRVSPQVADQWTSFLAEAPDTDDAEDWVARHPLRIPLFNLLFSGAAPSVQPTVAVPLGSRDRVSEPCDSVNWGRRGVKRKKGDPAGKASSQIIQGPAGVLRSVPLDWVDTAVGRKACAPPKQAASSKQPNPRKKIDCCSHDSINDSCDDDSDCEDVGEYKSAVPATRGPAVRYFQAIGSLFDDEEDGNRYCIVDVCTSNEYDGLFFKYIQNEIFASGSANPGDYDYTPCSELMNAGWAQWIDERC